MSNAHFPWAQTTIRQSTNALVESVARVRYMALSEARIFANATKVDLIHQVARWRVHDPEKFELLVAAVQKSQPKSLIKKQAA